MNEELITINFSKVLLLIKKQIYVFLLIPIPFLATFYLYNSLKKDRYISSTKILPEVSHKPNNGMGGLFMAAKSFGKNKELYNLEVTSPSLYSEILKSSDFLKYVSNSSQKFSPYILENSNNLYALIQIDLNKSGLTTLKTAGETKELANELNSLAVNFLINYLKKYRTQKAYSDLEFIKNAILEDINLKKCIIEQQKLIVQDQTPVFTILDKENVSKEHKHPVSMYFFIIVISQLFAFLFFLFKDKAYLDILEKTANING